jgi:four helix bundle protein
MTYDRFEDLPVWLEAAKLYERVEDFLDRVAPWLRASFRDQLERAVVSVSNNIAEGFERGTTNELLAFLYIARGSSGEVRSMLCLLERRPGLKNFKSEITNLKSIAESCSRQLRAWADSLQNSEIKGQRHLNDSVRREAAGRKRTKDFQASLLANLPPDHPLRRTRSGN